MSFWGVLLQIVVELLPIIATLLKKDGPSLQNVRDRALELQAKAAQNARWLLAEKEDELNAAQILKLRTLDELLRTRSLRSKSPNKPAG